MTKYNSELSKREQEIVVAFYRKNPELFFERELGIKLKWHQQLFLKLLKIGGFKYE